jgi:hypothetical protein
VSVIVVPSTKLAEQVAVAEQLRPAGELVTDTR